MTYAERPPPAALRMHVESLWTFHDGTGGLERVVPDGRCELVVHLGTPYRELGTGGRWRSQPPAVFAGQLTRPLWLRAGARGAVVLSARLRPESAGAFLGRPAHEVTDARIAFTHIGDAAVRRLRDAAADGSHSDALAEFAVVLQAHAERSTPPDPRVAAAVRDFDAMRTGSLSSYAARRSLSVRQLERLFAEHVGVPPRTYRQIRRFRRVFDVLEAFGGSWTAAAAEAGYYDQPELARDFRRFVGCTAREFHATRAGLTDALALPRTMSH